MSKTEFDWLDARDFGASGLGTPMTCKMDGSNRVTVEDASLFRVGQQVAVEGGTALYTDVALCGPNGFPGEDVPYTGQIEMSGYNGSNGSWVIYMVDVPVNQRAVFGWSDNLGESWHRGVPIVFGEWIEMSGGVKVKFHEDFTWEKGYTLVFSCRDQLSAQIIAIEGNDLLLDRQSRVGEGRIYVDDTAALQAAVDAALRERKNLFIPSGHYRLTKAIFVDSPCGLTIEGGSDTLLDISDGRGECLRIEEGEEITVRNLKMLGGNGLADMDKMGFMNTQGATEVWGFYRGQFTCAIDIRSTSRGYFENCHARKMSGEAFHSMGRWRQGQDDTETQYTRLLVFDRCSAIDCARNAFNNCDRAENTILKNCRIIDVGGCSWEGSSRYVKMTGCYVRNAGSVAIGNLRTRTAEDEAFPNGQQIIENNIFESGIAYGGCAISVESGCSQVIIRGNQFINFNGSAINLSGDCSFDGMPGENYIVTGNSIDMTAEEGPSKPRYGIRVTACDSTVSDNQIFVRGYDENVTAIVVRDDALRINVHDNIVRGCGVGIRSEYCMAHVGKKMDEEGKVYERMQGLFGGMPPLCRRRGHGYRGWQVIWLHETNGEIVGENTIDYFDPESCLFHLKNPDRLEFLRPYRLKAPHGSYWNFHHNILEAKKPLDMNTYGAETVQMNGNFLTEL